MYFVLFVAGALLSVLFYGPFYQLDTLIPAMNSFVHAQYPLVTINVSKR
jgi:hypothetical protein